MFSDPASRNTLHGHRSPPGPRRATRYGSGCCPASAPCRDEIVIHLDFRPPLRRNVLAVPITVRPRPRAHDRTSVTPPLRTGHLDPDGREHRATVDRRAVPDSRVRYGRSRVDNRIAGTSRADRSGSPHPAFGAPERAPPDGDASPQQHIRIGREGIDRPPAQVGRLGTAHRHRIPRRPDLEQQIQMPGRHTQ